MSTEKRPMSERIRQYKIEKDAADAEKKRRLQDDTARLLAKLTGPEMREELAETSAIMELAHNSGIDLKQFEADSISHKLGFLWYCDPDRKIIFAILSLGSYADTDLWVSKDGVDCIMHKGSCNNRIEPTFHLMNRFINDWPEFKKSVYDYLDKICPE